MQRVDEFETANTFLKHKLLYSFRSPKTHIAEGEGRTSVKEQAHFIEIALGSLNEVMCQLELANELGYINENQLFEAEEQVKAVAQMLAGLRNSKRRPS